MTDTGEPALFPRLATIVLMAEEYPLKEHQALRTAVDMSLKDLIAVRKEARAPIQHLYVDKRMRGSNIWTEVNDIVAISFFDFSYRK